MRKSSSLSFKEPKSNRSAESNSHADALANLASVVEAGNKRTVEVETLEKPSIELQPPRQVLCLDFGPSWMDPIIGYLRDDRLFEDKNKAHIIKLKAARFWLSPNDRLYKKLYTRPYLQCIHRSKVEDFLYEIHEGICGSHIGGRSLAYELSTKATGGPTCKKTPSCMLENAKSARSSNALFTSQCRI